MGQRGADRAAAVSSERLFANDCALRALVEVRRFAVTDANVPTLNHVRGNQAGAKDLPGVCRKASWEERKRYGLG